MHRATEARYDGEGYGQFKQDVGEAVVALVTPIQQRYQELRSDESELLRMLGRGAEKATAASTPTLERMYERMGFVRRPDRDVPQSVWDDPPVEGLPPEWVGQAFLGYSWGATDRAG